MKDERKFKRIIYAIKGTEHRENFATEIIGMVKRKLWWYRVALVISLAGNIIQAVVWFVR